MSDVSRLESQREAAKQLIEQRDLVLKLSNNREFKKLIREEFMVQECARYAQISADPALKAEERADALAISQAAGHLKRWLNIKIRMGDKAENDLLELDEAIAEARAEADAEGSVDADAIVRPGEELLN
jgi:hypothetical protein